MPNEKFSGAMARKARPSELPGKKPAGSRPLQCQVRAATLNTWALNLARCLCCGRLAAENR
jgi:hypothetical protein